MGGPTLKPTLPARYRIPIYLRLRSSLNISEVCALYPPPQKQSSMLFYHYHYYYYYKIIIKLFLLILINFDLIIRISWRYFIR